MIHQAVTAVGRAARALLASVLLTAAGAHAADAPAAPPELRAFFGNPMMERPMLSPDGRRVAVLMRAASGRQALGVVSLEPPGQPVLAANFRNADVVHAEWVNSERLVFSIDDLTLAVGDRRAPGLFAVNADGQEQRQLIDRDWRVAANPGSTVISRVLPPNHYLLRTLRDGSADVLVERANYNSSGSDLLDTTLLRLDTRSGQARAVLPPGYPDHAETWLADERGQPMLLATLHAGQVAIHLPEGEAGSRRWVEVARFPAYGHVPGGFTPWEIGPDGELYVRATRSDAEQTEALFRFDRENRRLASPPLVSVQGFDFSGSLIFDHRARKLLGVRYVGDATSTHWLDPALVALQARVDKRLPGTINLLDPPECGCTRWVVVTAYSDRQPSAYFLYDREADALALLGQSRPDIDPRRMGSQDFVRITARDGLSIPVHVTRPAGPGPWPAVVLVHGGPHVRGGSWRWRAEPQFLASRGYLVIEPEFRGSTGYGQRLFRAGWKQWGLAMQDDVADATRWAIAQKLADPQRICIAGSSYGGYATLMGLLRDGDLYRCGAAWAAVTDITMMYDVHWSDLPDTWKQHGMPALIGDPGKDAAQLEATSPLRQAARIKQPLLLAFGGQDRRVPFVHGTRFHEAVRKTNPEVEWIEYLNEGHGWSKPENRFDFYARLERFLARHLAPAPAAATPQP